MLTASFSTAQSGLTALENELFGLFISTLTRGLRDDGAANLGEERIILEKLPRLLKPGTTGGIEYRYEIAMPLYDDMESRAFHEALLTLRDDDGTTIKLATLLAALNNPSLGHDLGAKFRLWLMCAQINDFYQTHEKEQRLSLNIVPFDMDHDCFRQHIGRIVALAREAGYRTPVLETVENGVWTAERRQALLDLDTPVAIDDYGAADGHHTIETLTAFAASRPPPDLFVKLDGGLMRSFMDDDDMRLVDTMRQVLDRCPNALIVAEWVQSDEEENTLENRLRPHGLHEHIHFIQSHTIHDSVADFLKKMNRPHCLHGPC